jgi:PleD family two-component response regulator
MYQPLAIAVFTGLAVPMPLVLSVIPVPDARLMGGVGARSNPRIAGIRGTADRGAGTMRILLIEDDLEAAAYLVKGLTETSHVVDHAGDGEQGLRLALAGHYDVVVVDRMLPGLDGLSVVRTRRAEGQDTPHCC